MAPARTICTRQAIASTRRWATPFRCVPRSAGTSRVGVTTSESGRDYPVGYALGVLDRAKLNFQLVLDVQCRPMPM